MLALVSVVLIVLILSFLATTILAQKITTNNIMRGQHDLAISLTDQILFELENKLLKLNELTGKSTIMEMVPAILVTELRAFQSHNPTITNLYVADHNGQQVARSDFNHSSNVASTEGFQKAMQGMVYFSDLFPVILSSQYQQSGNTSITSGWQDSITVSIFMPVLNGDSVIGVLGANINLFRIQPLIENLTFTHDETVMVLSKSGQVVAHSHKAELGRLPDLNASGLFDAFEPGSFSIPGEYNDEMGRTVKGVIHPIGKQGWSIVVQTPVSMLSEEVRGLWLLLALVLTGGIAVAIAVAWLMAIRLTHPIRQLAHASEQVANGELTTNVKTDLVNEVGTLVESFNRMVSELNYTRSRNQQLLDELKQLNENLEKRIEERTEELKIAKDQADTANKVKSDFIANLSHELRTPLTSINGFSESLQGKYFGQLNEKQSEYIRYIRDNSRHMISLIHQIVDLEKIEDGEMEMELSRVNIYGLLEISVKEIRDLADEKKITIDDQMIPEIRGVDILADEGKLHEVIINILSNAVKFTPEGGQISVKAEVTEGQLIIKVADTGIGISSENQGKVFDDFFQVKSNIYDKITGLGLGLGLSKRLIEMHNGKIWVESEGEGKGSQFILMIPIISQADNGLNIKN